MDTTDTYATGYLGVPGTMRSTNVHVLNQTRGVLLCGYKPSKRYEWQHCSNGINLVYVECARCAERARKLQDQVARQRGVQ